MKTPNQKYFINDKEVVNSIEKVLSEDETILWRDKPLKKSFILSPVFKFLPLVILWVGVDVSIITCMILFMELEWYFYLIFSVFFLFHLMPLWFYYI